MKRILLITVFAALALAVPVTSANAAAPAAERVIAELALPASASSEQIAVTTDQLLGLLPVGSYTVNNRYSTIPFVGLSASPAAMSVLRNSGLVTAVHRDGVVSASASKNAKKCKKYKKNKKKYKACLKKAR
jgi:hypothetical protein